MSTGSSYVTFGLENGGGLKPPTFLSDEAIPETWPNLSHTVWNGPRHTLAIRTYYVIASTGDEFFNLPGSRCLVTGDIFDRPDTVERFTAHNSEWVSTFDLDRPPTFVVFEGRAVAEPAAEEGNPGYRAVLWLKDFFAISQKGACTFVGVPEATFYVWQNNPSSLPRSAGARMALKLRASLELAIARTDRESVHRFVSAGSPSIEDRLRNSRGAPWERAVSEIAQFGTYEVFAPLQRISSTDEYLRRVREVDETAANSRNEDGARLMSESEIRNADQEGW